MPDSIDDLVRLWRVQPDGSRTLALCASLRGGVPAERRALVDELARLVVDVHGGNGAALLALALVYLDDGRLVDAQRVLALAGRASPREPQVFRAFGEVLLRRGEADKAAGMFDRAVRLGANDEQTVAWRDRAIQLQELQTKAGTHAVAVELKGTTALPAVAAPAANRHPWSHEVSVDQDGATVIRPMPTVQTEEGTMVSRPNAKGMQREPTIEVEVVDLPPQAPRMPSLAATTEPDAFPPRALDQLPTNPVLHPVGPVQPPAHDPAAGQYKPVAWGTAPMAQVQPPHQPPVGSPAIAFAAVQPYPAAPPANPAAPPAAWPAPPAAAAMPGPSYSPSPPVYATPPLAGQGAQAPSPFAATVSAEPAAKAPRASKGLMIGAVVAVLVGLGGAAVLVVELYPDLVQQAPTRVGRHGRH